MSKTTTSNKAIISALFPHIDQTFQGRLSTGSQVDWDRIGVMLSSETFTPERNAIFNQLVNRIALVKFAESKFSNPLAPFKTGAMAGGDVIQEIAADIPKEKHFEIKSSKDQFAREEAQVRAAYHRVNRRSYYKRTIDDAELQYAFSNEGGLQSLNTAIVSGMRQANTIDEYQYTKKLLTASIYNKDYELQPQQTIYVPDIIGENRSQSDINLLIERIRIAMRQSMFPSQNFNMAQRLTTSDPHEMVCILDSRIMVINEINNLSATFNPEYIDMKVPIIGVDCVDETDDSIIGVIVTRRGIDIKDTKLVAGTAYNAESLYNNYFLHIHQIYSSSPFENFIVIRRQRRVAPV